MCLHKLVTKEKGIQKSLSTTSHLGTATDRIRNEKAFRYTENYTERTLGRHELDAQKYSCHEKESANSFPLAYGGNAISLVCDKQPHCSFSIGSFSDSV